MIEKQGSDFKHKFIAQKFLEPLYHQDISILTAKLVNKETFSFLFW